jgi:glyoxylase-like metal-dependent hydrolase (beta-lactamase superfamily II)
LGELSKLDEFLYVLRFPEPFGANCPIVCADRYVMLMDTYMGPLSMAPVHSFLESRGKGREFHVIISHSHFDHIWGNSAFPSASIVSHARCRMIMMERAESEYQALRLEHPEWVREEITIVYPNVTFEERLTYHDSAMEIELFHVPGHSSDSIAAFLSPSGVLLAGDSVEDPFPLLSESGREANIDLYLRNLKKLKKRRPSVIIPGHGERRDSGLIDDNIDYLGSLRREVERLLQKGITPDSEMLPAARFLTRPADLPPFYTQAHSDNIEKTACYLSEFVIK